MLLRRVLRLYSPSLRVSRPQRGIQALAPGFLHKFKPGNQILSAPIRLTHKDFDLTKPLDLPTYDHVCSETLESLCEFFEQAVEDCPHLKNPDVAYGDGVITIDFGSPYGSYVINRQRPNLQIWLSSPTSGPKRYDFLDGRWIYKHDGVCLHDLLEKEISVILKSPVDLSQCAFYKS